MYVCMMVPAVIHGKVVDPLPPELGGLYPSETLLHFYCIFLYDIMLFFCVSNAILINEKSLTAP